MHFISYIPKLAPLLNLKVHSITLVCRVPLRGGVYRYMGYSETEVMYILLHHFYYELCF